MSAPSLIGNVLVEAVDNTTGNLTNYKVPCASFWANQPCVIIFFRRFGCQFCRKTAKELSEKVKPVLDQYNVRLIGIGFDSRFVDSFVQEGYFSGELYIDAEMECYKALQLNRSSYFGMIKQLFSKKWIDAIKKGKEAGVKGDLKGDSQQNGGALVVDRNGVLLYEYYQEDASCQISPDEIFKALSIPNPYLNQVQY